MQGTRKTLLSVIKNFPISSLNAREPARPRECLRFTSAKRERFHARKLKKKVNKQNIKINFDPFARKSQWKKK